MHCNRNPRQRKPGRRPALIGPLRSALFGLMLLTAAAASAEEAPALFSRVDVDDLERPRALQIAIVTYGPAQGGNYSVDLVGAIHVGDPDYYAALNARFPDYDALLYELVAPRGAIVTPDTERDGLVSNAQLLLTRLLDLSFQLDEIDYTAPNFIHADLSGAELSASMAARDESLYTYFWRIVFASIREYAKDPLGLSDWQMIGAVVGSEQDQPLKTALAYEMTNIAQVQQIFGEDSDSAIIGARNERAIQVLREQLDAGAQRVGIFFGVGHMPDLEDRLLALGLERRGTTWLDAWRLDGMEPGADTQD